MSPLAAYDATSDRFLLLDVSRYKYPAVWVRAEALFAAMNTTDGTMGASRGWVVVQPPEDASPTEATPPQLDWPGVRACVDSVPASGSIFRENHNVLACFADPDAGGGVPGMDHGMNALSVLLGIVLGAVLTCVLQCARGYARRRSSSRQTKLAEMTPASNVA
jgi:hypothetical protein